MCIILHFSPFLNKTYFSALVISDLVIDIPALTKEMLKEATNVLAWVGLPLTFLLSIMKATFYNYLLVQMGGGAVREMRSKSGLNRWIVKRSADATQAQQNHSQL